MFVMHISYYSFNITVLMKKISIPVLSLFFLFLPVTFLAQDLSCPGPMVPVNPGRSPQFGKDIPIYNLPEQNIVLPKIRTVS